MVEFRLPALRQDLKLLPGGHDEDGAPRYLLHDRVRNRYFTLSIDALALIRHWQPGRTLEEMHAFLQARGLEHAVDEIRAFSQFLLANNLVLARSNGASDAQLFSDMRFPSSRVHVPPVSIAVTSGDAW